MSDSEKPDLTAKLDESLVRQLDRLRDEDTPERLLELAQDLQRLLRDKL